MFFKKKKNVAGNSDTDLKTVLERVQSREQLYRTLSDDFITWLGDFALEEENDEIESAQYRLALDTLRAHLRGIDDKDQPAEPVTKQTAFIPSFIEHQQKYLKERDKELSDVVGILTKAVVDMNSRNDAYDSSVNQQIESMTELTRLEDIRRLRSGLLAEIEHLRTTLVSKQEADAASLNSLQDQVAALHTELEMAQEESRRDGLTGIYNRRAFDWYLNGLLNTRGRRKSRFSLMMLDLDNFKIINDQHGHHLGDRVLLGFVEICQRVIRNDDFFARFGGDEFAIVFMGESARVARRKGNEICKIVNNSVFTVEATDDHPELALTIGVSIGVTEYKSGEDYTSLLQRADTALYEAKGEGKNCVRVA